MNTVRSNVTKPKHSHTTQTGGGGGGGFAFGTSERSLGGGQQQHIDHPVTMALRVVYVSQINEFAIYQTSESAAVCLRKFFSATAECSQSFNATFTSRTHNMGGYFRRGWGCAKRESMRMQLKLLLSGLCASYVV